MSEKQLTTEQQEALQSLNTAAFVDWKNHECTQRFMGWIGGVIDDQKAYWAAGAFQGSDVYKEALENARAQGFTQFAQTVLDVVESIHIPEMEVDEE